MNFKSIVAACFVFASVTSAFAQNLTVLLQDANGAAVAGASVTFTQSGATQSGSSDANGKVSFTPALGVAFNVTILSGVYDRLSFGRTIPASASWGTARAVLQRRAAGSSYVAEWRVGTTGGNEDPEADKARFNFSIKYYRDGSAIPDATITLTDSSGSTYKTLTSDANGTASCLVKEGERMSVQVTANGYAPYNTALAPGKKATSRHVVIRMRKSL